VSRRDPSDLLPLSTPVLHILLALGHERMHGYGIMQAIEQKTEGAARVLPGTLYTTLNRMLADGLVEEMSPPKDSPDDDRRRRYYRTTPFGREVVAAEADRMTVLLELARRDLKIT
jgi:DNA-binding PadR family transcriptional regulator